MIKMKKLLIEGIFDGIDASFIIDSGLTESSVQHGRKSMSLPRYSVWGFKSTGNGMPKLMENSNDLPKLLDKHGISEEDVYPIENGMTETVGKVGRNKWAVFSKKGRKRLSTHDTKKQADEVEANKENKKPTKKSING